MSNKIFDCDIFIVFLSRAARCLTTMMIRVLL